MKTRDYYVTPKSSALMRMFWKAAGGDRYLLERATYSDQIKYMCLGGIVIATGAMAGLAGGYAFYTIFSPKTDDVINKTQTVIENAQYVPIDPQTVVLSVIFGIIWGLIIYNIDRFIVTSTGKGDGTEKITLEEFKGAIPRILMGMIIALTISQPIEIRMFKSEIDVELSKIQKEKQKEFLAQIDSSFAGRIGNENKKIAGWQAEIDEKEADYTTSEITFNDELKEKPSGSSSGYGPDARKKEAIMNDRKGELIRVRTKNEPLIKSANDNIIKFEQDKQLEIAQYTKVSSSLDGLLERIKIAHKITNPEGHLINWISLFITLLFMAIELTPIFFKLMLTKTPYDYLAENRDDLIKAEYGIEVRYDYYKDKEGMERHLIINHEAERMMYEKVKVTEIQKELTDYAIEQYKSREKSKIDANLDEYIKRVSNDEPGNRQLS